MTTDHQMQVDELFEQAVELPENARQAFVERACEGDDRLLAEVQSLLEHDTRAAADFLCSPRSLDNGVVSAEPDQLVGQQIGDFRILRRIATGGMGSVYEAEQEHPRRVVALKIMHSGLASKSAQRRFEHEAQILGRLQHPNIAHIYQSGVWKAATLGPLPMPYFAMEHVPGARPITDYARDRELDIRRRLELFIQVCNAVHHGHQKGVIHRDLKPSNILIDAAGNVKVIDFGVARCTDSDVTATTMHTCTGELVGTLQYMSPEQCAADPMGLDIRSDVYSLGVVLFELLTSSLPYDLSHKTIQACARLISEEPPVRPSTLDRHLKGNLDAILLRALDKNREERYASVLDLAQDLQRHLSGEPIDAKPPGVARRAVRWSHRHPVATTGLACAAVIALAAAATALTVNLGYRQPSHLMTLPDGPNGPDIRELRVVSRLGTPLFTFGPYAHPSMSSPTLLPAPQGSPWSHYLVVVFSSTLEEVPTWRGKLCVFGVSSSRSDKPLWTSEVEAADMPPGAASEGLDAKDFMVNYAHPFDIFPEIPGTEIVACFFSAQSRRLIRIYGIQGEVLYQFWNDGVLHSPRWLTTPRLLVFAGENADCYWKNRGVEGIKNNTALTLVAVRPKLGEVKPDYLFERGTSGPGRAVWYKAILPPVASDEIKGWQLLSPEFPRFDPARFFGLSLCLLDARAGSVNLVVNEDGELVPGAALSTDAFNRNRDSLPDYTRYYLGELPACRGSQDDSSLSTDRQP